MRRVCVAPRGLEAAHALALRRMVEAVPLFRPDATPDDECQLVNDPGGEECHLWATA